MGWGWPILRMLMLFQVVHWLCSYDSRLYFADNALCWVNKCSNRLFRGTTLPREEDTDAIRNFNQLGSHLRGWLFAIIVRRRGYTAEKVLIPSTDSPQIEIELLRPRRITSHDPHHHHHHHHHSTHHPSKPHSEGFEDDDEYDDDNPHHHHHAQPEPPADEKPLPMVVWFHGGGFVSGHAKDLDLDHVLLRYMSTRMIIASVGYRLSPEARFPNAVQDALEATKWLFAQAEKFGGDPERFAVAGIDAGGTLAAVIHQQAQKENIPLKLAGIFNPRLRYGATTRSYVDYGHLSLPTALAIWQWRCYCDPKDTSDPRCCPMAATMEDLRGLAPAVITSHRYSPLRDEIQEYYRKLVRANVHVYHTELRGSHAFALTADQPSAKRAAKAFEQGVISEGGSNSQRSDVPAIYKLPEETPLLQPNKSANKQDRLPVDPQANKNNNTVVLPAEQITVTRTAS
mmetsp:Transcript_18112/g.35016  ORF Transcript_18112/g.35016 Transcript_18112/m.35016 type:complete len:456 (+) Transcript_18112:88-1455(+)